MTAVAVIAGSFSDFYVNPDDVRVALGPSLVTHKVWTKAVQFCGCKSGDFHAHPLQSHSYF